MTAADSFEDLYRAHVDAVFAFCAARTSRARADDLTADVFCRALGAWDRFEDRGISPRAWLMQIAYHRIVEEWRSSAKDERRAESLAANLTEVVEARVEMVVEQRDAIAQVLPELGRLPEQQRTVLAMRFLGEMSVSETAQALGVSEEAVRAAAHRGVKTLRARLAPVGED